ncbi:MAG: HD domain-containing protein [Lachnospiraceae bacterium]|nr:HD domain-containing protein [Lachnospiraceae bacterium]
MNDSVNPRIQQRRHNIIAVLLCAAGILVNVLMGFLVSKAGLPLYLDTVGTIAVATLGGCFPGVIVGFLTNSFKAIYDQTSVYYGFLNVMIAVAASWFTGHGWLKKPAKIVGVVAAFTLIGGGLGALLPWFMEGLPFKNEPLYSVLYQTGFFNQFFAHLISSIVVDFPDKAASVFLALLIRHIIPEKYHKYFEIKGWRQTPVSEVDSDSRGWKGWGRVRLLSLGGKIVSVLCVSLITVSVASTIIGMTIYHRTIVKEHTRLAQGTAKVAAGVVDGDHVDEFLEKGNLAEGFDDTRKQLSNIINSSADIAYLHVYQIREDGCHVVFDIDTDDVETDEVGSVIPFDDSFEKYIPDLLAGNSIDPIISNDKFGHFLTAYEPIYDSHGNTVCYAGADVDMSLLHTMEEGFLMEMVSVFLGFFILLIVFVLWFIRYSIIIPVNTITRCVDGFAEDEDTQEAMDEDVKAFRRLDVRTGDEIERLYQSLCRMTLRQTEQMRNIRRLSDSTAKMQDGLIITMADMVENRDSDTGAHIQKTAAYVKIIVEGLRKKGYYTEKITPKFMSDVVRSAPLHDVGKINISDKVLNKPGKLDDEEYEIMKTHTTHGKKIMEDAISTVAGENYLKEARNMAAYHHERWDGKGYPEGLHGEVIPLSARIMAVADVFDALTSPRVYKPAFPVEKALSIIEEGKGTQFDPKCVEVFMDSLDEVMVILNKYNKEA